MTAAFKYEWRRLTSLASTWWITGTSVGVSVGFTLLVCMFIRFNLPGELKGDVSKDDSRFFLEAGMTQFSNVDPFYYLVAFAIAILGVLSWGHEYRHGMIRATLTAVPNRTAVWAAKFVTIGAWVAAVVVISCVVSLMVTMLFFGSLDFDYDWGELFLSVFQRIVFSVLLTWLVMAVTELIRHQTFALVLLYLWPLGVESLLRLFFLIFGQFNQGINDAARFMPFNAGSRIIQDFSLINGYESVDGVFDSPLSALGGAIIFGGITALVMAGSLFSFRTRDA
ncbi:ABC transporter permease subunit [Nocardioides sp. JQ2195]|uniref:ABC transporter permease n=1 Tax=Nocardioides sp. JQ2195 TaxID=2592334 RepID=UPI00143E101F|nr:ABC transporter permease [Nocardioides sp. JQ2195]QIX25735.1 ABC transporter permease subunit [Nocardioides sp. JQ2195]